MHHTNADEPDTPTVSISKSRYPLAESHAVTTTIELFKACAHADTHNEPDVINI